MYCEVRGLYVSCILLYSVNVIFQKGIVLDMNVVLEVCVCV